MSKIVETVTLQPCKGDYKEVTIELHDDSKIRLFFGDPVNRPINGPNFRFTGTIVETGEDDDGRYVEIDHDDEDERTRIIRVSINATRVKFLLKLAEFNHVLTRYAYAPDDSDVETLKKMLGLSEA